MFSMLKDNRQRIVAMSDRVLMDGKLSGADVAEISVRIEWLKRCRAMSSALLITGFVLMSIALVFGMILISGSVRSDHDIAVCIAGLSAILAMVLLIVSVMTKLRCDEQEQEFEIMKARNRWSAG